MRIRLYVSIMRIKVMGVIVLLHRGRLGIYRTIDYDDAQVIEVRLPKVSRFQVRLPKVCSES